MPITSQPKSSAIRKAAMYILHWPRIWSSVRSVSGLEPVRKIMPLRWSQSRTAWASPSLTRSPQGGDVHLALAEDLVFGEIGFGVGARAENHAFTVEPVAHRMGLAIANAAHGGIEGGLAQALLEDAEGHHTFIGNDGVIHSHATFVEDTHDGAVAAQVSG